MAEPRPPGRDYEVKLRLKAPEHEKLLAATPPGIQPAVWARALLLTALEHVPSTAVGNPVRNPTPEPKDTP